AELRQDREPPARGGPERQRRHPRLRRTPAHRDPRRRGARYAARAWRRRRDRYPDLRACLLEEPRVLRLLSQPAGLRALARQGWRPAGGDARRRFLQVSERPVESGRPAALVPEPPAVL